MLIETSVLSLLVFFLFCAAAFAVTGPAALGYVGFAAIGPTAGSIASMGIGGAGGGATLGFSSLQSVAMGGSTAKICGGVGAAVGAMSGSGKKSAKRKERVRSSKRRRP
jgi:hypothetical protein